MHKIKLDGRNRGQKFDGQKSDKHQMKVRDMMSKATTLQSARELHNNGRR
jgi:hypothetical protein